MQQSAIQNTPSTPAQGAQGARNRAAAGNSGSGAADPTAGFSALLALLGQDDPPMDALLPATPEPDALAQAGSFLAAEDAMPALPATDAPTGEDPLLPAAAEGATPQQAADAATLAMLLALQGAQPGAAQAAAQPDAEGAAQSRALPSLATGGDRAGAPPGIGFAAAVPAAGAPPISGPADRAGLALQGDSHWAAASLVAETSRLDGALDAADPAQPPGTRAAPMRGARPAGAWTAGALRAADIAARRPADLLQHPLAASAALASSGQPAASAAALAGDVRHPDGPAADRSAGAAMGAGAPHAAGEAWAAVAGPVPAWADGAQPRAVAQARHELPGATHDTGGAAAQPDAAAGPHAPDAAGLPGADPGGQAAADAAQTQAAERVAWWVHQRTQSAALTVQDGGQAVQVQVALTGDQAHITFRSDEAQARQLLDSGTAELRALLDAQGLQLAGVSVGPSSQGGGGASGSDPGDAPRPGARQGLARVPAAGAPEAAGAAARRPRGVLSERSVDVFV